MHTSLQSAAVGTFVDTMFILFILLSYTVQIRHTAYQYNHDNHTWPKIELILFVDSKKFQPWSKGWILKDSRKLGQCCQIDIISDFYCIVKYFFHIIIFKKI